MLWKLYFWLMLFLNTLGVAVIYTTLVPWKFSTWIEIISSLISLLGIYSYIYKKKIISSIFWLGFFWVMVLSWFFSLIYVFTPLSRYLMIPLWLASETITTGSDLLLGIVISLPTAYAIYKLGYEKHTNLNKGTKVIKVKKQKPIQKKIKPKKKPA